MAILKGFLDPSGVNGRAAEMSAHVLISETIAIKQITGRNT